MYMKKQGSCLVISTVYSGNAVQTILKKFSPEKIVLLIDKGEEIPDVKKMAVETLKKISKGVMDIETMKTSLYDLYEIMDDVIKKIDSEYESYSKIILHITKGRKMTSLGLLFAGYSRKDKISGIYYVTQEKNDLIPLPLMKFGVGNSKRRILGEINKGIKTIEELKTKLSKEITEAALYKYLSELRKEKYLKEGRTLELTELGRIASL